MTRPKIFDDLAGVASGAMSALSGLSEEIEQRIAARLDEAFRSMRLVRREEFDAALELASNARTGQERVERQLGELEERLARLEGGAPADVAASADLFAGEPAAHPDAPVHPASVADAPSAETHPHLHAEGGLGGPPSPSPD